MGQFGVRAGFSFDSRDSASAARRGMLISVQAGEYPGLLGGKTPTGEIRSKVAGYLAGGGRFRPVLALRAGGDRVWGRYPFFDAALVGGAETVRGFDEDRFAGDGSLYGNAELRAYVTRIFLLMPADFGVFGLADVGRVFQSGESSSAWHSGFGGGVWISILGRANTFSLAAARSVEGTRMYFRSGFLY
jgi:outer membrane protein assembly factor BamA